LVLGQDSRSLPASYRSNAKFHLGPLHPLCAPDGTADFILAKRSVSSQSFGRQVDLAAPSSRPTLCEFIVSISGQF
jgi:hypothetical protein